MQRLYDYTVLDQEAAFEKETDIPYRNYCVKVKREQLAGIERQVGEQGGVLIVRKCEGYTQRILEQADQNTFTAPEGFQLLDPTNADLANCRNWHRIVAVNGKRGASLGANALVQELCNGTSSEVVLQIQSGWLVSGAHVVIKDLVAGYGDIPVNVLKSVSIDIMPRTKVGVVGTTGCGKSTLLLCILRILEARTGKIFINDVDIAALGLKTLRTSVGMVAQDPVLMQCSVRDNLDPFDQFDDELLWRGLEVVQMKDCVGSLPNGLGFEIQADSGNLSYGQRQLLCMARMVIRQPALILLDEATSALDPATQQQVQYTVENNFPDSTMIMIAHRLETIVNFDKVLVMDRGLVVEEGSPTQLREAPSGVFAKMWAAKRTW
jgi:ABC-type multidrug transport system fused ATPase/permease subunit